MTLTLVCATANAGKIGELRSILGDAVELLPRPDDVAPVVEDAGSLVGNARLKATAIARASGRPAIADDTGLEVAALGGLPGVDTASFAGEGASDDENWSKLLAELAVATDRRARFRTVAMVVWPDGRELYAEGVCDGEIAPRSRGGRGFGYDSVFVPAAGDGRSFAEMSAPEKDAVSHRGKAFAALLVMLRDVTRGHGNVTAVRHHDLVIVGTGSGNSIPGPELEHLDIAIVEGGTFGGTCLNVGCIPTKMLVYPADLADGARRAADLDVEMHVDRVDWPALRDRVFGRIDPIAAGGKAYREGPECPNITVYSGYGHFVGERTLDTGTGVTVTADRFVLAAGGRATVPEIPGLELGPRVHTSDTIMRIDELPRSLLIVGGGFIAAEFAHVFSAFGVAVTQVVRTQRLLRSHDDDIAAAFTAVAAERWTVLTDTSPVRFDVGATGVTMVLADRVVAADLVLVATGRTPNSDRLDVAATGVDVDPATGLVAVDDFQRTTAPGIFALGDISSRWELKHVANHEARVVRHNLVHPEAMIGSDHRFVPSAVFTDPQIATVGLTEQQAIERGVRHVVARHDYAWIAAGWAREDTTGFVKILADPDTGLLLGAHIIGPEAATVIQPLIQAMSFGQTAHEVATGQYWIHPALPEVIENALLKL